ncbi:MAG TPA: DUF3099 domain-containing protein [Streptosporangiaceae bacterium]|nr:DUF3099 domain-containing protein [Streptosporangiaceae bacterium]
MVMRRPGWARRSGAQLVTEAQRSRSDDIRYRERRYLIMMAIRVVCFVIAVVVFAKGGGWLTAIPAVGAIAIPYFAVVFANGGREPSSTKGFRAYEPNLPAPYRPPGPAADRDDGSQPPASANNGGPR